MADHSVELNAGGSSFYTLIAYSTASLATYTGAGSLKGYVFNAGKKKVTINSRLSETLPDNDVEMANTIFILPGMAVPLPDGCVGFSYKVADGFSTLYWIPGTTPPVFSMSMSMGADGLFVEDYVLRRAIEDLTVKIDAMNENLTGVPTT